MPRISIYVPDELKARMDKAGDRANWSGIAQRAFETEIHHLEAVKEIKSMSDVIERLRASKEKSSASHESDGRAYGQKWAKHFAEYDQLRSVARLGASALYEGFADDPASAALASVVHAIVGEGDEARLTVRDRFLLAEVFGIDEDEAYTEGGLLNLEWLSGFVAGAQEVWDEIKDEI